MNLNQMKGALHSAKGLVKVATNAVKSKSPTILTAVAVAGLVGTVFFAIKGTKRAMETYDILEKQNGGEEPDKEEVIKKVAPHFVPVVVLGSVTVASIIGAHTISMKRNAALVGLYSLSEKTLKEYKSIATTEQKEKVEAKMDQDLIEKDYIYTKNLPVTPGGRVLCYDTYIDREFISSMEWIQKCVNEFNHRLIYEYSMSLNEFYGILGLNDCHIGDMIGWKSDRLMNIDFRSRLRSDGTPCLVLHYTVEPTIAWRNDEL